jgi:hypothetical protein
MTLSLNNYICVPSKKVINLGFVSENFSLKIPRGGGSATLLVSFMSIFKLFYFPDWGRSLRTDSHSQRRHVPHHLWLFCCLWQRRRSVFSLVDGVGSPLPTPPKNHTHILLSKVFLLEDIVLHFFLSVKSILYYFLRGWLKIVFIPAVKTAFVWCLLSLMIIIIMWVSDFLI